MFSYYCAIVPEPPVITRIEASYDANGLTGLVVNYIASLKVKKECYLS